MRHFDCPLPAQGPSPVDNKEGHITPRYGREKKKTGKGSRLYNRVFGKDIFSPAAENPLLHKGGKKGKKKRTRAGGGH